MNRSTFPLVDRLFDGHLAERLTTWRRAGDSYETIARHIEAEKDHVVSASTVGRWIEEHELEPVEAVAS